MRRVSSVEKRKVRLLVAQGLSIILLLAFSLSVKVSPAVPALSGPAAEVDQDLRTLSVFDFLWKKDSLAKEVLRLAFPMLRYAEEGRHDGHEAPILFRVAGYFLGFIPQSAKDLAFGGFPGFLLESEALEASVTLYDPRKLEDDWGYTPVMFSLPPGEAPPTAALLSGGPLVAIYHTHATESYLPEIGKTQATEAFSSNMSKTVMRVGDLLAQELETRYRIPVLHSRTVHDAETRVGAYYRSEQTVRAILDKYPSCTYLIDLHRDSQPRSITAVTIRGKPYARVLFVVGTDNPNWVKNYEFSRKLSEKLEEAYPGISRGVFYESAVYNQKYSPNAILVECGGVGNTMEECENTVKALAWALASLILPAAPDAP
ncbi:MAG TPA: stage II sporulation protein P [Firmicutes bacterium]|nr:stage II sporulation protein P [Candidatus Fermentithermobacillaceae bacterium]